MQKLKRQEVLLQPQKAPAECQFKVLQWNVLADGLAQNGDFVKVGFGCAVGGRRGPQVGNRVCFVVHRSAQQKVGRSMTPNSIRGGNAPPKAAGLSKRNKGQ